MAGMKRILLVLPLLMASCVSMTKPEIGMSERAWLARTLVGDIAHMDREWTVYKSGGAFYHFKDGRLHHVDQGTLKVEITQGSSKAN